MYLAKVPAASTPMKAPAQSDNSQQVFLVVVMRALVAQKRVCLIESTR